MTPSCLASRRGDRLGPPKRAQHRPVRGGCQATGRLHARQAAWAHRLPRYTGSVHERAPALSPTVASALSRFRAVLAERFGARLREVVLYGSHARGTATEDSDVDVLVVVDDLT